MLCVYILPILLLGYGVQGAITQSYNYDLDFSARVENAVKKKCQKNANPAQYEAALKELNNIQNHCWDSVFLIKTKPKASPNETSDYFKENLPGLMECFTKFAEKFEPCLEAEEIYLKQFIVDGFEKFFNYLGEHINIIIDIRSTQAVKCIERFSGHSENDPHKLCYAKSKVIGDNSSLDVVTKAELCLDLQNIISCFETMLAQHCNGFPELQEFGMGMVRESYTLCYHEDYYLH